MMLELIKADLAKLGIQHDVFFSERTLHGQGGDIDMTLAWLREKGLVYQGRLEPPKGQDAEDWEDRGADAVPRQRIRRRRRPAAGQVGRLLHLFRRRHRLSPQQIPARLQAHDQRARRRPFGLHQAARGGGEGGVGRRGRHGRQDHAAGAADEERRAVQDEQAVAAISCCSSDVVEEVGVDATRFMLLYRRNERRWISTSRWSRSRRGTIRCSTCSTRTPGPARSSGRPATELPALDLRPKRAQQGADWSCCQPGRSGADQGAGAMAADGRCRGACA